MKCPCKDCPDRFVGCHASCEKYKEWSAYDIKRKKEEKEKRKLAWSDNYYTPSRNGKRRFGK